MEQGNPYRPRYQFPPTFSPSDLRGVAEFLNVDSDRWVFRRFGKLHLFNILGMQQRLARLQHELDMQISGEEPSDFDKLLPAIQHALSEYDAALSAHAKYKSYKEPGDSIVEQLDYWGTSTKENGEPLRHGLDIPCRGTKNRKDLASIAAVEKTWTHRFIDRHACLAGVFKEKAPEEHEWSKSQTLIYSEERVRHAEGVFLHVSFCILLLSPIIALSYLGSKVWKLVILGIFLFAASVLSVGFLDVPNKSGLALVAGYAAILVVFLSNNVGS